MGRYFHKSPESEFELIIDWRQRWLQRNEKIVGDLGWSVRPVEDDPQELRVIYQAFDPVKTRATLCGGIPKKTYMVSSKVCTNRDRELERSFIFRIAERNI